MTSVPTCPAVPVSWGELLDKLTILQIKRERIEAPGALANVAREHDLLSPLAAPALAMVGVGELVDALRAVNMLLWDTEDAIRAEEKAGRFGEDFVTLARSVYQRNDERCAIKRRINLALGSALVEEKSYVGASPLTVPA